MKRYLMTVATSAILMTTAPVAVASGDCSTAKSDHHRAVITQSANERGAPQTYSTRHHSEVKTSGHTDNVNAGANIVEVARSAGSFNTLIAAVKAAGLSDTLSRKGPYTVFAPTDAAFARLPAGTLSGLLADKSKLVQFLTYHVVPGELKAKDVTGASSLPTVAGSDLNVANVKIAKTDVSASNGVIHVIDEVLMPEA